MKKIQSAIAQFFLSPVPPEILAFFRLAISVFALVQVFVLVPDWLWLYGPQGMIPWQLSEPLSTTHMPALGDLYSVLRWTHISAVGVLYLVTGLYLLSLTGLLVGYKTTIMATIALAAHTLINTSGHFTAYGVETFTHIALFYCMVLPVNVSWSLDARIKAFKLPAYLVTLGVRLIQLHLCIMYLSCGIEKASGIQWWNGEAIWIAMQQDQFHHVNIDWMARFPIIPKILCWSTMLVEGLYPFGMLSRTTRKFWLVMIVSMHAFIGIFLGLYLFAALMILLNVSVFGSHNFNFEIGLKKFVRSKMMRFILPGR